MPTTLTPVVLINAVTASGTFGPFPIDYKYEQDKLRSISGIRSDINDDVYVLLETVVPVIGQGGAVVSNVIVTATATVFTNANGTYNSCVIQGPYTRLKLQKAGSSGAATFVGIL